MLTTAANGNTGVTSPSNYQRLVSYALRLTSAGPRFERPTDHNTPQFVGGIRGDLGWVSDFTYDVSGPIWSYGG